MDPMSSQGDLLIPTGTQATAYRGAPVSSRSTSAGARAARARRHGATVAGTLLLALSWGCGDQPFDEGPDQAAVQPDLTQIGTRRGALTFTPYLPFQAGQTASIPQSAQGWCGSTSSHTSPIQNSIDFSWSGCKGEPVLATAGGTVTYVHGDCADNGTKNCFNSGGGTCSCNSGLGNLVVIDHGGGVYSAYAHLNPGSLKVSVGEQVCTGKHIADIGHTGFGSGPHLHFHFQNVAGKIYGTSGATLTFDGFAEASAPVCGSVTSKNTLVTGCAPPSWWCSCIDDLEAQGLLSKTCSAYTNGQTFDRATFAKIVGDALDIESTSAYSGCANPYSDVPDDEWYENYVSALAHLEYGDGVSVWSTSSSKFNPGNSMTRCEGLKVIAEAWDLPPSSKSLPFSDLGDFPAWCLDYAKRALAAGVISSTTGAFGPNEPLTVGGAACMVGKTITANGAPKPPASAFVGCGSACSDECTSAGQKSCVGTSGYRTCGDYDADSCLEWSSTTSCGGGKQCSGAGTCASVTSCGDGSCDGGETQSLCCVDCGCPGGKSCNGSTCVTESFCGDGSCNGSETQGSCCLDCGCPSGKSCNGSTCVTESYCGDGSCNGSETQGSCCLDCGCPGGSSCNGSTCVTESFCGDGSCNGSETQGSCCLDCGCPGGSSCQGTTCVVAPFCGDGSCNGSETQGSCCLDCGCPGGSSCQGSTCVTESFCGDGSCNGSETQGSCCLDCGCPGGSSCNGSTCVVSPFCGDGSCNGSETQGSCCLDCGCPGGWNCQGTTCVVSPFCGDGSCNGSETQGSCCVDCGCDGGQQCTAGQCVCTPECAGKTCGPDGCGGSCGPCAPGQSCESGVCSGGTQPCVPSASRICQSGNVVLPDSCGNSLEFQACEHGCADGVCLPTPSGGTTVVPPASGCGSAPPGTSLWPLAGLALVAVFRRRQRALGPAR